MYLVGYNSEGRSYRLWDPAEPSKIPHSAEVSFREKEMRDVVKPKDGHDPSRAPSSIVYVPAQNGGDDDDAGDETEEGETGSSTPAGTSSPEDSGPRRTSQNPKPVQRLNLLTQEAALEQIEHALVTGSDFGNLGRLTGGPRA